MSPHKVTTTESLPPVRACIFDLDGLLINTCDIATMCTNKVLARYDRPALPWSIRAQLMGVQGGSTSSGIFQSWAQLPISPEQYGIEYAAMQKLHFPDCVPLPGAESLLEKLTASPVELALASSTSPSRFELKMTSPSVNRLLGLIPPERRILGDGYPQLKGRGKPAPDIFLLALETINAGLPDSKAKIRPEECLVFEDSVAGVEAARRAGMRVVWVPHAGLLEHLRGREWQALAGLMREDMEIDEIEARKSNEIWAEQLGSLEEFSYEKYGIEP